IILLASCSKKEEPAPEQKIKEVPPKIEKKQEPIKHDTGTYSSYYLSGSSALTDLSGELGKSGMFIVCKLNRRDLRHLKEVETIVIPNHGDSEMTYSPYPLHIAKLDSVKKILFVSRKVQAFAAYDSGRLVRWGPTSTGKKTTQTPAQLFHTNWKSLETHSTVN